MLESHVWWVFSSNFSGFGTDFKADKVSPRVMLHSMNLVSKAGIHPLVVIWKSSNRVVEVAVFMMDDKTVVIDVDLA